MDQERLDEVQQDRYDAAIARRVLLLGERMDQLEDARSGSREAVHPVWALTLGCAAMVFGFLGMGTTIHPYPYLFSILLLFLAYHRRFLRLALGRWRLPQVAVNFLVGSQFFVILLGGGTRHPFAWFRLPAVIKNQPQDGGSWYHALVPDYTVQWQNIPGISDWIVDMTKVQAFLLLATMAGALFRFHGFASVTALALLLLSIPVYLSFSWDWVVLFMICGSLCFYLQSRTAALPAASHGR